MQELRCCNWSATYATSFVFVTCACVRHVRAEFAKYDQGAKVRPELEAAQASARGGGEANEPELLCRWSARKLPVAMDRSGSRPSENAQLILRRYDTFDFEAEKSKHRTYMPGSRTLLAAIFGRRRLSHGLGQEATVHRSARDERR